MRYRDGRRSLCLSSQSGCPLTCTFCATGAMRFGRNLTASEILDQALHFRRREPVNHAVYMGMGEPFLNVDAVLESAARLPDLGITHRRTTISTVGWLPGLRRFVDEVETPIRLALSIHAADPGASVGAHARERPLCAGGRARGVPPLLRAEAAQGVRRVRHARGRERLARARPAARRGPRATRLQGQPHPVQPDGRCSKGPRALRSRRSRPCSSGRGSPRPSGSRAAATSRPRAASSHRCADGARHGRRRGLLPIEGSGGARRVVLGAPRSSGDGRRPRHLPGEPEHVWAPFSEDTEYWPAAKQGMVNFTVRDLDAMLAQLRAAGVEVDEKIELMDGIGRFGWAVDPEGTASSSGSRTQRCRAASGAVPRSPCRQQYHRDPEGELGGVDGDRHGR